MSEFKFACPVCGQHITANSDSAGSQLECPTCFRKIVVPQPPASSDPKFILSAAEANKPRPAQSASSPGDSGPVDQSNRSALPIMLGVLAVLVVVAIVTAVIVRAKRIEERERLEIETAAASNAVWLAMHPVSTNNLPWLLDLSKAQFPTGTVSGRIRGRDFVCERATVQGGNFTLRTGRSGTPDLALTINFFSNTPEALAGKTINVTTNNTGAPRLTLRWKENGQAVNSAFTGPYALRLEFGPITASGMAGKIYICLADDDKTCAAGSFNAEIRRPQPRRRN